MTFQIGDRVVVTMRHDSGIWNGRTGVVIRLNIGGYTDDVTEIRFDDYRGAPDTNKFFTRELTLIAPITPEALEAQVEAQTAALRGRIQARIDMYKSIEHPGGIALGIIEELEGVLRDA